MANKTILIVDDDANVLKILGRILTGAGYSVLQAENGKDGIAVTRDKKPDLVLLDINMPDMGGGDVSQIWKDNPHTRDIPVGFVTELLTKNEVGAHEPGRYFFIAKPINTAELLQKIKEHLA